MIHIRPSRFGWVLVLSLGLWAVAAQAQEFRYHYVSLDQVELPSGFVFFDPKAINNRGRIYGDAYGCTTTTCDVIRPHIAVYADGTVTVLQPGQPGIVNAANERGTIGGSVLIDDPDDPTNFIEQAALFRGSAVQLIPRLPGERTNSVTALNDSDVALVTSFDAAEPPKPTYVLYSKGQTTPPLDFGPTVTNPLVTGMNNQRIMSGIESPSSDDRFNGAHGFRFDPRTGETTLLNPLPTERNAWGLGINNRGDVLGYSFITSGRERIGVWNRNGTFKTYFVEGIPEFPTISNSLLFNDNNQIVITFVSSPERFKNSYLVPKPGVRLNLADLVENLPLGQSLGAIFDINNHGDMIGTGGFFSGGNFLLERIDATGPQSFATPDGTTQSPAEGRGHGVPPAVAAALLRHLPPLKPPLKSGSALP